jgi:hypothetical protein
MRSAPGLVPEPADGAPDGAVVGGALALRLVRAMAEDRHRQLEDANVAGRWNSLKECRRRPGQMIR